MKPKKIPVLACDIAVALYGNGQYLDRHKIIPATIAQVFEAMNNRRNDIVYVKTGMGDRPYVILART